MKLDPTLKYGYLDKAECFWRFSNEKVGEETGWFVYLVKPGEKGLFIGKISESEIIRRLKENPPPLTSDDFIDLELWMAHGGLEIPKVKKERKTKKEIS